MGLGHLVAYSTIPLDFIQSIPLTPVRLGSRGSVPDVSVAGCGKTQTMLYLRILKIYSYIDRYRCMARLCIAIQLCIAIHL